MNAFEPRPTCLRCRRPTVVCYCDHIVPLATRTRVVILQHPRERDVPVNTARIAALCLPESELHVGVEWSGSKALARATSDPARPAALLYPGPDAIDIEENPPSGPITLVVVDGTWWQARKLVKATPELAALPRYSFRPSIPSQYRIRAEPHDDYVSTIEAMAHVLGILENDRERYLAMLAPFRAMVERQLEFAATGEGRHRIRKRPTASGDPRLRIPKRLHERFDDLVCVHGEINAWHHDAPERIAFGDELVQWTACRVASGEVFERFVAPKSSLAPSTLRHLQVDASAFEMRGDGSGALAEDELLQQWASFIRPSDVICSWGTYATRLFEGRGGRFDQPKLDVRNAARIHAGGLVGTMATFLGQLRESASPLVGTSGRAQTRLGELATVVRSLAALGK